MGGCSVELSCRRRERVLLDSDGRPLGFNWDYSRAEVLADGVIHAIGVALGLAGAVLILVLAIESRRGTEIASALVYAAGLLAVFGLSAAYNLWPVSPAKWLLRRFDHSAIYLLIAATYTPFLLQMKSSVASLGLLAAVWATALAGMALKLFFPGRFDRLSVGLYLALGWSGLIAYDTLVTALPHSTLALLAAGGALYSIGVVFHAWRSLRFQNAVWHAFVLAAALCHYLAVLDTVALAGN
jgi:hemolysin III